MDLGKSTILRIIARKEYADSGSINIRRGAKIGLLNQIYEDEKDDLIVKDFLLDCFREVNDLKNQLNELESKMINNPEDINLVNLYCKLQDKFSFLGGYDLEEKYSKICTSFSISENMQNLKYNDLSGGEKTRINLAKIILSEPDILLLDEPTNHLDIDSLEFLEDFLINYKGTVLVVSHDRYFLDKVTTKTILLENGKEKIYFGNYSYFLEEDERRTLAEFENYKSQQKQIQKMQESIDNLRKFGRLAGNEMFFKRAKSIEKRLEKLEKIDKPEEKRYLELNFKVKERSGSDVIVVKDLTKKFDNKDIFEKASMQLSYGEKAALIGKNGTGKTTLIRILLGEDKDYLGEVKLGSSIKLGYIPQKIEFKDDRQTILDFFMEENSFFELEARNKLARYGFRGENVFKKIGSLSGGEKVRILLLRLIQKDINFLILDEPTNHIDIDTREILEEALLEYKGTVLFVSHDRYFINKLAKRVLNIENEQIKSYYGNYDDFCKKGK